MYLYIVKFTNNKKYIGITSNIQDRKRKHKMRVKRGDTECFYNDIRKYGWDNLEWVVLGGYDSWEHLCAIEVEEIGRYNTYMNTTGSNGYNMTLGGEGTRGFTHSKEYRERLSKGWTGEGNPNYGKKISTDQKRKLKTGREKHRCTQEGVDRQKANTPKRGRHHNAKLTLKEVDAIRNKFEERIYTYRSLAKEYKISETTTRIIRGLLW